MIEVTPELLMRHNRPGPHYTSYPAAVEFTEACGPSQYAVRLVAAAHRPDGPLSF